MAYDAPDDWPEHRAMEIRSGGMTVRIGSERAMREPEFRKKAARMILNGIITPDLLAKLTE